MGSLWILYVAIYVLVVAGWWMIFTKAGQEGWKAIIPFYNLYILLQIVGREGWWLILFFIPIVNIVVYVVVSLDLAKSFGRSGWFAVGLIFLPVICPLILGFGDARYVGPAAKGGQAA